MSKLRKLHVVIIGVLVCIIVGAGMYFLLVKKAIEAREAEKTRYNTAVTNGGTQQNVITQKANYEKAVVEVNETEIKYQRYMRAQMPLISLADRKTGMLQLWHEQSEVLGPLILSHIQRSGVKLSSEIKVDAPKANPNEIIVGGSQPITLDLGKIKVEGDFKTIIKHLKSWNSCKRLAMIENPALAGNSPNLACEYNLKVFLFPASDPGEIVPLAPAGGDQSGMGGMLGGGMPGGMPSAN